VIKWVTPRFTNFQRTCSEKTFKEWVILLGSLTAAFSFICLWINAFYFQAPVSEIISFRVEDGWCPRINSGLGIHCFSDYYSPVAALSLENPWSGPGYAYTPLGAQQFVPFEFFGRVFNNPKVGLLSYLMVGAVCVLTPLYWAGRGKKSFTPMHAIIFGVLGTPLLSALDRGSVVMFTTPVLLYYALSVLRGNWSKATYAIVLLSVVKPQYLTLLLPLIMYRQWRELIRGLRYSIGISVVGFILFTNDPITVFRQWLSFAVTYNEQSQYFFPYNVSVTETFAEILNFIAPVLSQFSLDSHNFSALATVIILGALLILPLVLFGNMTDRFSSVVVSMVLGSLLVPTSNFYYQNFVVVIIALILKHPLGVVSPLKYGTMDEHGPGGNSRSFVKWLIIIAALNSCFNLPISSEGLPIVGTNFGIPTSVSRIFVGPLWLLVLVGINLNLWMSFRAKTKGKSTNPTPNLLS
jgi:hypothetical protein